MSPIDFRILAKDKDSHARLGELRTAHKSVATPVFMPVGTQATVKTMTPDEVKEAGAGLILANTYHLYLRPGHALIERMGGLHKFMGWDGAILTDSGGYQVFSLSGLRKIKADGVWFSSHIDGSRHFFSPEKVMEIQNSLGSDIAMVLDECMPFGSSREYAEASARMSAIWAGKCKDAHDRKDQALFGIVQGAGFEDIRLGMAKELVGMGFDGYAIGGLSVGESKDDMYRVLSYTTPALPEDKPRYLMGVGSPDAILEAVALGIDMFDCVLPTRIARNGTIFTDRGRFIVRDAGSAEDESPIDEGCDCYACRNFSRAYVRHLLKAGEVLGIRLTTMHNVRFMMRFMERLRASLAEGRFAEFLAEQRIIWSNGGNNGAAGKRTMR